MTAFVEPDHPGPSATDGGIAAINLESSRRGGWVRFAQSPRLPGVAEAIVYDENLAAQFLGDLDALDRLAGRARLRGTREVTAGIVETMRCRCDLGLNKARTRRVV